VQYWQEEETLELDEILHILNVLNTQNVRYVLIGGVAMRLHGCAHLTDDLDICYARDVANLTTLAAAFAPYKPRLRGVPPDLPFLWDARTLKSGLNFTLTTSIGDVDMLGEAAGTESFDGLWERSVTMQVDNLQVHVASIADLIAMKRAANRFNRIPRQSHAACLPHSGERWAYRSSLPAPTIARNSNLVRQNLHLALDMATDSSSYSSTLLP
jgi:hypothetical protein